MMPALILNKSSRVIPGFLGTPAGMTTAERCQSGFQLHSPSNEEHPKKAGTQLTNRCILDRLLELVVSDVAGHLRLCVDVAMADE